MKSYNTQKMKSVSYYSLPDGMADVYLRRELPVEKGDEENDVFVYDEVNFKISVDITEDEIRDNFDLLFEDAHAMDKKTQTEEELLVDYVLELDMRFIMLEFGLQGKGVKNDYGIQIMQK